MRCVFAQGKQSELLIYARLSLNLSWHSLDQRLGTNYTSLREWRDEKWHMPYSVFVRLIEICPECKSFKTFLLEFKER